MAKPVSTSLHDQSSTVRQLKVLVVILVLSNIALGGFSFYLLRSLDRGYTALISRTVPALNDLQTLTASCAEAMRTTGMPLLDIPAERRPDAIKRARLALDRDRMQRKGILSHEWLAANSAPRAEFQAAGDGFSQLASDVVKLAADGQIAEAGRLREETLRPAFDRYLAAATNAADVVEAEGLRDSSDLTAKTGARVEVGVGTGRLAGGGAYRAAAADRGFCGRAHGVVSRPRDERHALGFCGAKTTTPDRLTFPS